MTTYRASNYKSHRPRADRHKSFRVVNLPFTRMRPIWSRKEFRMRSFVKLIRSWFSQRRERAPPIGCSVLFVRSPNSVGMVLLYGKRDDAAC